MPTATTSSEHTLSKADAKLLHKHDFKPFDVIDDEDVRSILTVSIFRYDINAKGNGLRHSAVVQVRGERGQGSKILKVVKATVKALNAGESFCGVISVPTGRPRGRRPAAAA